MKTQTVTVKGMQGFTSEGIPQYMLQTPNAQMTTPANSADLPMFTPQAGHSDGSDVQMVSIAGAQGGNEMAGEVPGMDIVDTYEP